MISDLQEDFPQLIIRILFLFDEARLSQALHVITKFYDSKT
jgi:hypothetical protein